MKQSRRRDARGRRIADAHTALGHLVERAIADGTLADYADAAQRFGITRAQVCQVVSLTLLSPEIQEAILAGEVAVCERELRGVSEARWERQGRGLRRR